MPGMSAIFRSFRRQLEEIGALLPEAEAGVLYHLEEGEFGEEFQRLVRGERCEFRSDAEADLQVCRCLAPLLGNDLNRIVRMFWATPRGRRKKGTTHEGCVRRIVNEALRCNAQEGPPRRMRPMVILPGRTTAIMDTARRLGILLNCCEQMFDRGGVAVLLSEQKGKGPTLVVPHVARMRSEYERFAQPHKWEKTKDGWIVAPTIYPKDTTEALLLASQFVSRLPPIKVLSRSPVLVPRSDGTLVQVVGYDRESGILASGDPTIDCSLEVARQRVDELLRDFDFASAGDRSRAIAALIAPALVRGGLLNARVPLDIGEADQSQSGKGFRHKLTAAVYHEPLGVVTQRTGRGVGALVETCSDLLIRGYNFISLDNVRGRLDEPAIESLLTEDVFAARAPYSRIAHVDPRRTVLMLTSNKAELTVDQANRSSVVRIKKRPHDYEFAKYAEGNILSHLRANWPCYLGAVHRIVQEWWDRGQPRTDETRHDFRDWAQVLDWIVRTVFGAVPLLDGHQDVKRRVVTPALTWLRDVALATIDAHKTDQWLAANQMLGVLQEYPDVEIPGLNDEDDLNEEHVRKKVWQAIGRKLAQCFGGATEEVVIDGIRVKREERKVPREDGKGARTQRVYLVRARADSR